MKFKSDRIVPSKQTFPIFVNMIENFPFGSVIMDLDDGLKILANNRLLLRILGFKTQEEFESFYHGSFLNIVHDDSKEEVKEFLNQFLEMPETDNDEIIFKVNTPDGSLKWVKKEYYKQSRKSPIGYVLVTEWKYPQFEKKVKTIGRM